MRGKEIGGKDRNVAADTNTDAKANGSIFASNLSELH